MSNYSMTHEQQIDDVASKIDTIKLLAKDVVFQHGYTQKHLYEEITTYLEAHSTRKRQILYNTVHGGFSYSKQFCEFAKIERRDRERIDVVPTISVFGKHVATMHPIIFRMCYAYEVGELEKQLKNCQLVKNLKLRHKQLEVNYAIVEDVCHDCHGDKCIDANTMPFTLSILEVRNEEPAKFREYTHEAIIALKQKMQSRLQELVEELSKAQSTVDLEMLASLDHNFPEEIEQNKLAWYERKQWAEPKKQRLTFLDAVNLYGEDHFAIWKCQHHYKEEAMRYLILCPDTCQRPYNSDILERVYTKLGLVAASGAYASLAIEEVPWELSWSVFEYDGLECIHVD